jgi:nucleoside phosphorylase
MDTIASVRQKEQLAARYGAMIVDMEAATVARLARAHGGLPRNQGSVGWVQF